MEVEKNEIEEKSHHCVQTTDALATEVSGVMVQARLWMLTFSFSPACLAMIGEKKKGKHPKNINERFFGETIIILVEI